MQEFTAVKDSGSREEFPTGSVRDTQEGKPRFELVPVDALTRLAMHYTNGAKKYGDRNWEKGQPIERYFASLFRHAYAALDGKLDEDHLAAVAWNVFAIIHTQNEIDKGTLPRELLMRKPTLPTLAPLHAAKGGAA